MLLSAGQSDPQLPMVMVTGASGFIGSHVVEQLLLAGFEVLAVVRSIHSSERHRARVKFIECDLHDHRQLERIIAAHQPTACIHSAWTIGPDYQNDSANDQWIETSLELHRTLRRHHCQWLGAFGTCIESESEEPVLCRYARAKASLRRRLFAASDDAIKLCWWRVFQPFGPGEPGHRLLPSLIEALVRGRTFCVEAPDEVRDFIHVEDIARAAVLSLTAGAEGVFDLGSGTGMRVLDVALAVADLVGGRHLVRTKAPATRTCPSAQALVADTEPFRAASGWSPQRTLESGLAELIERAACDCRITA
jgi:nucleoside-diphosphate-sugar epimerase